MGIKSWLRRPIDIVFIFLVTLIGKAYAQTTLEIELRPVILIDAKPGSVNRIEYSSSVEPAVWIPLTNVTIQSSPYYFIDPAKPLPGSRFYRTVPLVEFNPDPTNLVWISPGTFLMGTPADEIAREPDEEPQTRVTFDQGFFMAKWETTQADYFKIMGTNPSYFTNEANLPVEGVNWQEAMEFCSKLTARDRASGQISSEYQYRLPTEAEWEYACRAGTATPFSFGTTLDWHQANFHGKYPYPENQFDVTGHFLFRTRPVGGFEPNAFGLYDMHGNVAEWCLDWYDDLLGGSVTGPQGPDIGTERVVRGGSWSDLAEHLRSGYRSLFNPNFRDNSLGFRIVLAKVRN